MKLLERYKPKTINHLLIDKEKINDIKRFIVEKKPLIISGPTGSGKTTLVYLLAKDMDYEVLEINASDNRNKNTIEEVLLPAIKEASLFAKGRLILIDDVEALSGTSDRGGIQALANILPQTKWPILLTTSDHSSKKLAPIRKKTGLVELNTPSTQALVSFLTQLCDQEKIVYNPKILEELANKNKGDIRAILMDLHSSIKNNALEAITGLGDRERKESVSTALSQVFRGKDFKKVINSFYDTNIDLDEAMLWLDENLPREYLKKEELFRAYNYLSKSDIFNKRIRRWQYWRFLVYRNFFMTSGINLSRNSNILSYPEYKRSTRLLKYFWANQKNLKRKEIARKIAEKTHISISKATKEVLPLIKLIYKNGQELEDLGLTPEETEWLKTK
ncbi:MAG: replication factor C large subunit [Candidatus Woesearchaeota archaeon]